MEIGERETKERAERIRKTCDLIKQIAALFELDIERNNKRIETVLGSVA